MLDANLVQFLGDSIRHNWERPAFTDYGGTTLTYGQVGTRLLRLHNLFTQLGIQRGDKIALLGKNSSHWAVSYLAAVTYGAVIVPILPDFGSDEVHHIVNHSDAVLLLVMDNHFEELDEERMTGLRAVLSLRDFSPLHTIDEWVATEIDNAETAFMERFGSRLTAGDFILEQTDSDQLAAIVYTSGTTGFSKGVMLPHRSLIANVKYFNDGLPIAPGDRALSFLPLSHCFGCAFEFLSPFGSGCHITFLDKIPTPKILLKAFAAVRPRVILSVPLILEKIYRNRIKPQLDSTRMRLMLRIPLLKGLVKKKIRQRLVDLFGGQFIELAIGGAALNKEVEAFLLDIGFPLTIGYGMTECGPLITYTSYLDGRAPHSVGRAIDYAEVRIDSPDPAGRVGEILVRGDVLMDGYYKDADATAEALDADGWLHTGDLGVMDDKGFVTITGRSKSLILSASGQNIYPEEIEARLNNLPYVQESVVLDAGGRLAALVYPDMEAVDAENIDSARIEEIMEENRKALNEQLPGYSMVVKLKVYPEEFAKTPTKKIKRRLYTSLG